MVILNYKIFHARSIHNNPLPPSQSHSLFIQLCAFMFYIMFYIWCTTTDYIFKGITIDLKRSFEKRNLLFFNRITRTVYWAKQSRQIRSIYRHLFTCRPLNWTLSIKYRGFRLPHREVVQKRYIVTQLISTWHLLKVGVVEEIPTCSWIKAVLSPVRHLVYISSWPRAFSPRVYRDRVDLLFL